MDFLWKWYGYLFLFAHLSCTNFPGLILGKNFPGSDQTYLSRREFSFTLEQDIYVRYQSFKDQGEMEQSIKEKNPHKIDIGPVFNVDVSFNSSFKVKNYVLRAIMSFQPAKRNAYQNLGSEKLFAPVERELVFDIVR